MLTVLPTPAPPNSPTALGEGADEIDDLDTGFQQLFGGGLLVVAGRLAVNRHLLFLADRAAFVDGITQYVHDAAQGFFTDRYRYRGAGVADAEAAAQTFGGPHGNGTYHTVTQLLLDFEDDVLFLDVEGIISARHPAGIRRQ